MSFQRGVAAALQGEAARARHQLCDAIALYEASGQPWRHGYIDRASALLQAVDERQEAVLLDDWRRANSAAHGIGG